MNTEIWQDDWFLQQDTVHRLAFIYLFTNPSLRPAGIYKLALPFLALSIGETVEGCREILADLERDGKIRYDWTRGAVWIKNYFRKNPNNTRETSLEGARHNVRDFSECSFIEELVKYYPSLRMVGDGWGMVGDHPISIVQSSKVDSRSLVVKELNALKAKPRDGLIDYFYQCHLRKTGNAYAVDGGKDGAIMKHLTEQLGEDEVRHRIDKFFESTEPFILEAGYTIGVFKSQVNKLDKPNLGGLDPRTVSAGRRFLSRG